MKPVLENRGYKKVYHCPKCSTVIGQKNCGLIFGLEKECCNTQIDWSFLLKEETNE